LQARASKLPPLGEEYEMQSVEGKSRFSTLASAGSEKRSEAALRALAEAEERRRRLDDTAASRREINGRGGLDPVRYGDWEVKGIVSDF
jgi:hypothetical protein